MRNGPTRTSLFPVVLCLIAVLLLVGPAAGQEPSRVLPAAMGAPGVGEPVPDFTLPDADGHTVTFSEFLAAGESGRPGWVLLVFYRGYW